MRDRIEKIIQTEGINPSLFADIIGISRSSMNHILNGRNNPSLEVVNKILAKFDQINTDWLLFGTEPMYKSGKYSLQPSLFDKVEVEPKQTTEKTEYRKETELKTPEKRDNPPIIEQITQKMTPVKKIVKIMIFYSDNTYDSFSPEL